MRRHHVRRALDAVAAPGPARAVRRKTPPVLVDDDRWARQPGIQGFALGRRVRQGRRRRELVLTVYVARKRELAALEVPVPRRLRVAGVPDPVPTDVVEVGELERLSFVGREPRPVSPGVGLSHPRCGNGTFGCLVRRQGEPDLYILSNAHVIADDGLAAPGDPIYQPAGGGPNDVLAEFSDSVSLEFSDTLFQNRVDAAIARVLDPATVQPAIKLLGRPRGVSSDIVEDMLVRKTGSTTERTEGRVRSVDFRAAYPYLHPDGTMRRVGFSDLVLCESTSDGPFVSKGDSGAAVLNEDNEAVGLLFAGNHGAGVFCRMDSVFEALNLRF
jgi:hypothetical protein